MIWIWMRTLFINCSYALLLRHDYYILVVILLAASDIDDDGVSLGLLLDLVLVQGRTTLTDWWSTAPS